MAELVVDADTLYLAGDAGLGHGGADGLAQAADDAVLLGDDDIPVSIAGNGELYEQYCKSVLGFVEERFPDNLETMRLLLQEYSRMETADRLGIHRNTPRNQINSMKEQLSEILDGLFAMFEKLTT